MLVKIITLSFSSTYGGFNDVELRDLMRDHEIISVRDYFFMRHDVAHLTLIIKYFPVRQDFDLRQKAIKEESWRKALSESDLGLFNLLREWRAKRAKRDGLPPYILFTNVQLVQIVKIRPQSLTELMRVDGVGKSKADKYGDEILAITRIDLGPSPSHDGDSVAQEAGPAQ